jgi:hypothetical protein
MAVIQTQGLGIPPLEYLHSQAVFLASTVLLVVIIGRAVHPFPLGLGL